MKIEDTIYEAPEMSVEKVLELIKNEIKNLKKDLISDIQRIHKDYNNDNLPLHILEEFDLITQSKSLLSYSKRDTIFGLVSSCLVKMTKDDGRTSGE